MADRTCPVTGAELKGAQTIDPELARCIKLADALRRALQQPKPSPETDDTVAMWGGKAAADEPYAEQLRGVIGSMLGMIG